MDLIQQQQGFLQNAIVNIEEQLTIAAMNNIEGFVKNDINEETDLISEQEKKDAGNQLLLVLVAFFGVIMAVQGPQQMRKRIQEFEMTGVFNLDKETKARISALASKVSQSHIDTVSKDLYKTAREAALEGLSQREIISALKTKYSGSIIETRAKVIARTETNRAFTMTQYEADRQFVEQNELEGKVFKKWTTRSSNPCPFCTELEKQGEVPFSDNFADLGDTITVDGKKLLVNFEPLRAGNAHPNCSCTYELIIR